MPNWAYNSITFSGDPEKLEALKEQVGAPTQIPSVDYVRKEDGKFALDADNKPITQNTTYGEEKPIFSMWNISRPDPEQYVSYRDQGWYNWNIENWGTKWDAKDVDVIEDTSIFWHIRFETAWAPPHEALLALSKQHPDVSIRNEWHEEQGFGAHNEYSEGTYWTDKEWDIPQSHAEYVENLTEEDCPCVFDYDEAPFSDCPKNQNDTQVAVAEFEKASELV